MAGLTSAPRSQLSQVSPAGGAVAPAAGRAPSLQFTLRLFGAGQAAFNQPQRLTAWKAALKAALPGECPDQVTLASWQCGPAVALPVTPSTGKGGTDDSRLQA